MSLTTSVTGSTNEGSISASIKIDPLTGTENIAVWKVKITDILTSVGLRDHLTGSAPVKPDGAGVDAKAIEKWSKDLAEWQARDQKALSHIRLRVSDAVMVYIGGATTAKEAWDTLMDTFQPKGMYSYIVAYRKFFQTRCVAD